MAQIIQSTPYVHLFWMVLADDKTPALGKDVTVMISRAGMPFMEPVGSPLTREVGYGWYAVQLLPADTAVLGDLAYHYAAEGCDDSDGYKDQVIPPPPVDVQHGDSQTIIQLLGQLVAGLCPQR